jgi:hypothetical protein
MKRILALSLALASFTLAGASMAATEVSHFSYDGEAAWLDAYDNNSYISLSVGRGGTNQDVFTSLSFYSSSCVDDGMTFSCTGMVGWGYIPNEDFDMSGNARTADLSTDLANLTIYGYSYSCDYSTYYCTFEETANPVPGAISASWDRNSMYSYKTQGKQESDYLNYRFVSQGKSEYASADVEVDMPGLAVVGNGALGMDSGKARSIIKN